MEKQSKGFGHASFLPDTDEVYRRQFLLAKTSEVIQEFNLELLQPDSTDYRGKFQRYTYETREGQIITLPTPLTQETINETKIMVTKNGLPKEVDNDQDGKPDSTFYVIRKYQDHFIPSITLALALNYFHIDPNKVEVKLGHEIILKYPQIFNPEIRKLEPYNVNSTTSIDAQTKLDDTEKKQRDFNFYTNRYNGQM